MEIELPHADFIRMFSLLVAGPILFGGVALRFGEWRKEAWMGLVFSVGVPLTFFAVEARVASVVVAGLAFLFVGVGVCGWIAMGVPKWRRVALRGLLVSIVLPTVAIGGWFLVGLF